MISLSKVLLAEKFGRTEEGKELCRRNRSDAFSSFPSESNSREAFYELIFIRICRIRRSLRLQFSSFFIILILIPIFLLHLSTCGPFVFSSLCFNRSKFNHCPLKLKIPEFLYFSHYLPI